MKEMDYSLVPENDSMARILWTGGWDSTFSLLLLMERDILVKPYYIIDRHRPSYKKEIETMDILREAILEKYPDKKEALLGLEYIDLDDISIDREIDEKSSNLRRDTGLGSQYCWLASFAKNSALHDLQMSVVKDGRISKLLGSYSEKVNDEIIGTYWKATSIPEDLDISIFSYFRFPVMDYTKLDMLHIAKEKDFIGILKMTWFCHKPIKGQPCGLCSPCTIAIEEGLSERLPSAAIRRYRYKKYYVLYYKLLGKMSNIAKKERLTQKS